MTTETKIKDFVIVPRKIRDDYLEGKLTRNELDILIWIWLNTNPKNGYFTADYKQLEGEFRNRISYDNVRKIISSLRKKQYIHFPDHKGRKGSFPIYPIGFLLTSGEIQTLDYLKNKLSVTTPSQTNGRLETELKHTLEEQYHNFKEQKEALIKWFSLNHQNSQITTPYNDNNTENNKSSLLSNDKIEGQKSPIFVPIINRSKSNKSSKRIDVNSFYPKSYEEQRCLEIAKALGETDMRFLLSCLKKYGFRHLERVWGIFKEIPKEKIQNPRQYFNKLVKNLAENKNKNS